MTESDGSRRTLLIWMHSDRYPAWRIPDELVGLLAADGGDEWAVQSIRVSADAGGDGPDRAPAAVLAAIGGAEVYFGYGITRELLESAAELRWFHSGAAGVGGSLRAGMRDRGVTMTNSAGIYADPLAEWAIGAMLHFARGFDIATRAMREGEWPYEALAGESSPLREIAGSSVAVVGYGGIGRAIGMRAKALGMRVIAVRARPGREILPEVDLELGPDGLREALASAHYVVLALPETDRTRLLLGSDELAAMRPDAVLMNLSRGGIVDEAALSEALGNGALRGAALDVFQTEPLPPDSPLREHGNVLFTPHAGSISARYWDRQGALMRRNFANWRAGEPLVNQVDKERGY
ncbi:MAG: D-2-hydroxyacid dehydrogenase [marine benthic group bacterium]|nr:D-2-hydroxyacid dehydrogenase [Gemmatimonadota bacterium]MCL7976912.1 D-2-hydroxyacid dehydrogenase [Gemmatimonadota bacterium]